MPDLMQAASAWHMGKRRAHLTHPVLYGRTVGTAELTVTVNAEIAARPVQLDHAGEFITEEVHRDYLIVAAELLLGGMQIEPASDDWIEETFPDGTTHRFRVLPTKGEQAYRRDDPWGIRLRIHTTEVKEGT